MTKEYIVKGYYFEHSDGKLKKGLQEGKIILLKDNKIFGELSDLNYLEQGSRTVIGIYDETFPNSIHFIKSSPLIKESTCSFIYSLASENFGQNFGGRYMGYWAAVESNFRGKFAELLKIHPQNKEFLNIINELPNEKTFKRLKRISFDFLKHNYFNDLTLDGLVSFAGYYKQKTFLEFIEV